MQSGRELDERVAVEVMQLGELYWSGGQRCYGPRHRAEVVPEYSTDIVAAWQVVEKMNASGWWPNIYRSGVTKFWVCELRHAGLPFDINGHWFGAGETAPEAICRAALAATPHTSDSAVEASVHPEGS